MAVNADGSPVNEVDLNDGSVWVTNSEMGLLGRLNPQVKELDLGIQSDSGSFDVFQNGTTVLLDNQAGNRSIRSVDVAKGQASDPVGLPSSAKVAFGGSTIAVLDSKTGNVWVRSTDTIIGFSTKGVEPDAKVGQGGAIAVSTDGVAYALNRSEGKATRVTVGEAGVAATDGTVTFDGGFSEDTDLTVIGNTPIVLDRSDGTVHRPGADAVTLDTAEPKSAKLERPSQDDDSLYVGVVEGLLRSSVSGGDFTQVKPSAVDGTPAAPVVLDGCVHAAWADVSAKGYTRLCGDGGAVDKQIPDLQAGAALVFRVNRKVVVLNDTRTGDSWLVQRPQLDKVDNWKDVDPTIKRRTPEQKEVKKVDRDDQNEPPEAVDDKFGARPGQATIFPVTANDSDPDGDILTVTKIRALQGATDARLVKVGQDTQVQATFGPNSEGTAEFEYTVDDGNKESDTAKVTVTLRAESQNDKPKLLENRKPSLTVSRGQKSSIYLMPDWIDPDGDDVVLTDATIKDGGSVKFRADGTIEFSDAGDRTGTKTIEYTMSDGRDETTTTLPVTVSGASSVPPELVADRAVGVAGAKILVKPLLNDSNPDGTDLQLKQVAGPSGVEIVEDSDAGTFTAESARPGTYYLDYQANNFTATAASYIRLDVLAPVKDNQPPVAVKDHALLPPGGSVVVDLLANDYDPDDDVLVVQATSTKTGSALKASLLEKRLLRIEASSDLQGSESITYDVSDGNTTVQGSVVVTQRKTDIANRPPVAVKDRVTVRAGAVATIPVLDNDSDPDGDDLQLYQDDLIDNNSKLPLFVSGDDYRLRAPDKAGQYQATYGIRDAQGQRSSAEITIDVLPDTKKNNRAPRPDPIIDRATAGRKLRIDVDVQGSDPDGDAVAFKGVLHAPSLGRIVGTGLDWIEYEPFEDRVGTDSFEIAVEDKYGARGVADIRIGVAPRAQVNQAPVALDDNLLVKPNRTISYNVLTNDVDPDDDPLSIDPELAKAKNVSATLDRSYVNVDVPSTPGDESAKTTVGYTVSDALGGSDSASLVVTASKQAPFHPPITADDTAELSDIAGRSPGQTVKVNVLKNDSDLDGPKADLRIEAYDTDVSKVVGNRLQVTLSATDQVVVYRVIDGDDKESYGFVFVSGTDTVPPVIDPDTVPKKVDAGRTASIKLTDHVLVRKGRDPILTVEDEVSAVHSDGSPLVVKGSNNTLRFRPEKGFVGPASLTFEVTDGKNLNDDSGLTSLLTIPIDVQPTANVAPQIRNTQVEVAAEGDPTTLDLRGLATDANQDDDLTFGVSTTARGIGAKVTGGHDLELSSDGAKVGDTGTVRVKVSDGHGKSATGSVLFTVVSSTRSLLTVPTIEVDGEAGKKRTVDVADYAVNPYPGKPLTVSQVKAESGQGASVSISGSSVAITPASGKAGTVTVRFVVSDASGDPARDVTGRIRVSVSDVPDAPSRPAVSRVEAAAVVLSWPQPSDNGATITEYEVTGSHGFSKTCKATTCALDGLDPNNDYTFQVAARNKVGLGKKSPESAKASPDEKPDRMAAPTIKIDPKNMDGKLTIGWTKPHNVGSDVSGFELRVVGSGQTKMLGPHETSFAWSGLTNGDTYRFAIRAINKVPEKQEFSPPSQGVKPFGLPGQIGQPTAEPLNSGATGGAVRLRWVAPEANGDPITGYRITMYSGGSPAVIEHHSTATERDFTVKNGVDYQFTVIAENRAGFGKTPSAKSNVANPYGKASAPVVTGKGTESDHHAVIKFRTPTDDGGRRVTQYEVRAGANSYVADAPTTQEGASTQLNVDFGGNSGPYNVSLTPVSFNGSTKITGDTSNSLGGVRPFGEPFAPGNAGSTPNGYYAVTGHFQRPAPNGRPILYVEVEGKGNTDDPNASVDRGGDQACFVGRAVSEGESPSSAHLKSAPTTICGASTMRTVSLSFPSAPATQGCTSNCRYISVVVHGHRRNSTQSADIALGSDTNWCGEYAGPGCQDPKPIGINGSGDGSIPSYWVAQHGLGTVHVTVDGVTGSGNP